jgi:hypothetical protein
MGFQTLQDIGCLKKASAILGDALQMVAAQK